MELRIEEDGESERSFVMKEIRGCAIRQHHPTRKRADFRLVFHHENA